MKFHQILNVERRWFSIKCFWIIVEIESWIIVGSGRSQPWIIVGLNGAISGGRGLKGEPLLRWSEGSPEMHGRETQPEHLRLLSIQIFLQPSGPRMQSFSQPSWHIVLPLQSTTFLKPATPVHTIHPRPTSSASSTLEARNEVQNTKRLSLVT